MNTANDEPTIEHGATVYDGDEVALTAATVRHILRTPEAGSFLRGDWTGLRIPVKPITRSGLKPITSRSEAMHVRHRAEVGRLVGRARYAAVRMRRLR